METVTLINGYDRSKNPEQLTFKVATPYNIIGAPVGTEFWVECRDGKARRVRTSGAVRTWKRDPSRVQVPCKFGLYESETFENVDGTMVGQTGRCRLLILAPADARESYGSDD